MNERIRLFATPLPLLVLAFLSVARADEAREKFMAELNEADPPKVEKMEAVIETTLKIPAVPAIAGQPYELTITATNHGNHKIIVPSNRKRVRDEWVWDGIGIQYPKDGSIERRSFFTNPPTVDSILPGETKIFRISWTPCKDSKGNGELSLLLPPEFKPVASVQVVVVSPNEKADTKTTEKNVQSGEEKLGN